MPATLHLFSPFLPKIHPLNPTPFSCKPPNLSTTARPFSVTMSSSSSRPQYEMKRSMMRNDVDELVACHVNRIHLNIKDSSMQSFKLVDSSLASVAPLEAILFDIDGTLVDSDPIHYYAFREMLQEVGFNGGEPISEEFFIKNISGMHNEELCHVLFPDWDLQRARKFLDDKEVMFRKLAAEQLKPVAGLDKLCKWVEDRGLKRAAVTNAPRPNAEMIISLLGLEKFFQLVVIGSECDRAKPFPDPYLKALQGLGVSSGSTFVFEDSTSGINAGVAAGMPVVGLATRNPEKLLLDAGTTMVIKDYTESIYGLL
ncbi:Haloacid dehalogenase-like hydrolase domain-containing protein Sgpp [Sesamum angolense]|uniref:Haloacid dehalogenase-like hydrolase domain-containing protein Sgpp n=1 Tax=Sesamum angolense TaxID=2727404 RepID=A0AAE1XFK1_9LAMI|nr:Haloacid dehalogenase-like hydrolase domain-containing protein Sgpp [Sesamum angolense]